MIERKRLIITYIVIMIVLVTFGLISVIITLKNNNKDNNLEYEYNSLEEINLKLFNEGLFDNNRMKNITTDNVYEVFGIKTENIKKVIGKIPLADIYSGMYVVFEVNENNIEEVEDLIVNYGNEYEKKWSTYMEDQYELVKERKIGHISNYVYMFISENATEMVEIIKSLK